MSQTLTNTYGDKQFLTLQEAVGETIRSLRLERGMTLRSICSKTYISLGHLSQIERGQRNASNEFLESIARGLDVTTAQLVYEIYKHLEEDFNNG